MITSLPSDEVSGQDGWYVVYTKPRQEQRALENLNLQGFHCFFPTLRTERLFKGRLVPVTEALFPRYLFLSGNSNWAAIRSTRGVSNLVRFGGVAARVPVTLIEALTQQPMHYQELFKVGDQLKVINGPFVGIEAELLRLYESPSGEARVMVLMDVLTRPQKISLPASAVSKAA